MIYNNFMKKIVLITGGAKGIGKACVLKFSSEYHVIFTYNKSKKQADELVEKLSQNNITCTAIKADLSKLKEIENLTNTVLSNFKKVDVLINNAGISSQKLLIDESNENIENILSTNLKSQILLCRNFAKKMIENKAGRIINIASIWGQIGGSMESVYSASKAGVIGLTKALAKELALCNITVNSISPGAIETDMLHEINDEDLDAFKQEIPMSRFGNANEVADLCFFLASEQASYITGQDIGINGGLN